MGKPIAEHQAIQLKLGEMAAKTRAAELLVEDAARAYDRGGRVDLEAGMAKWFATETAFEVATEAMRIFGANGYSKEYPDRAALPRRAAADDRRGHQRDAADHHRPPADRAKPGLSPVRGPLT